MTLSRQIEKTMFPPDEERKYLPPSEERRVGILSAIAADYCTEQAIKWIVDIPHSEDISECLGYLVSEKQIAIRESGDLTAYFLINRVPKKFWRVAGRKIDGLEYEDLSDPASSGKPTNWTKTTLNLRAAVELTETEVEETAATEQDAFSAIAAKLGVSKVHATRRVTASVLLKTAYDRGRRRFSEQEEKKRPAKDEENMSYTKISDDVLNEENIERTAARNNHLTKTQAIENTAKQMGIGYSTLQAKLKTHPHFKEAFDRGYYQANVIKTPPEDEKSEQPATLDHAKEIEPPKHEAIVVGNNRTNEIMERTTSEKKIFQEPFEDIQSKFKEAMGGVESIINRSGNHAKSIALSDFGSFNLNADFNIFTADKNTRTFINNLVDLVQEFEQTSKG